PYRGARIVFGEHVPAAPTPRPLPVYPLDEAARRMEATIQRYDHRLDDRVRAWAMPFDAAFCSDDLLKAAKGLADRYHTGMTLHQSNRPATVQMYLDSYGKRPVEYLEDLGVLGPNLLLAHVIGIDMQEVEAIARTDTKTVMCPTAALRLGSRTPVPPPFPPLPAPPLL